MEDFIPLNDWEEIPEGAHVYVAEDLQAYISFSNKYEKFKEFMSLKSS